MWEIVDYAKSKALSGIKICKEPLRTVYNIQNSSVERAKIAFIENWKQNEIKKER